MSCVCWTCAEAVLVSARVQCPQCFAAHYCSEDCLLADRFQGEHASVCNTVEVPGRLARMAYIASDGAAGFALACNMAKPFGVTCFRKLVFVARQPMPIGSVCLRLPVLSGIPDNPEFVKYIFDSVHAHLDMDGLKESAVPLSKLPPISAVERHLRSLMTSCRLRHGMFPASANLGSLFGHLREFAQAGVSTSTLCIFHALVEWVTRESVELDRYWRLCRAHVNPVKVDAMKAWVDTCDTRIALMDVLVQFVGAPPKAVLEECLRCQGNIMGILRTLHPMSLGCVNVWKALDENCQFLGLRSMDVYRDFMARAQHVILQQDMRSFSPLALYMAHCCAPKCMASTTAVFQGVADWKQHGLEVRACVFGGPPDEPGVFCSSRLFGLARVLCTALPCTGPGHCLGDFLVQFPGGHAQ